MSWRLAWKESGMRTECKAGISITCRNFNLPSTLGIGGWKFDVREDFDDPTQLSEIALAIVQESASHAVFCRVDRVHSWKECGRPPYVHDSSMRGVSVQRNQTCSRFKISSKRTRVTSEHWALKVSHHWGLWLLCARIVYRTLHDVNVNWRFPR